MPYFGSRTRSATRALPVQLVLPGRCQSDSLKVGSGIQALVAKFGSTFVVRANVRQPLGIGVKSTAADARRGARLMVEAARPAFKRSRRFICLSLSVMSRGGQSLPSSERAEPSRTDLHRNAAAVRTGWRGECRATEWTSIDHKPEKVCEQSE